MNFLRVNRMTLATLILMGSAFVFAQDAMPEGETKTDAKVEEKDAATEKKEGRAAAPKPVRLTKPWSELTTLSDDQKKQISEIHAKAVAAKKEIDEKEEADVLALLNDAQKAEFKEVQAKARANMRRATTAPTTQKSAE